MNDGRYDDFKSVLVIQRPQQYRRPEIKVSIIHTKHQFAIRSCEHWEKGDGLPVGRVALKFTRRFQAKASYGHIAYREEPADPPGRTAEDSVRYSFRVT